MAATTELIDHKSTDFFCSIHSRNANESLLGSAPRSDVWFLLEYAGRWGSKAFKESSVSDAIKTQVNQQLNTIPNARLLLIKQDGRAQDGFAFYVARATATPPQLYRFSLDDYDDLLDINLVGLARGDAQFDAHMSEEPLFAVCTNGLRDQCCALNGVAAYQALSAEFGAPIWQSTHHGGHRFSANMLCMPYGLSYGHMDIAEHPAEIVGALLAGELPLENLRGRSIYDEGVQAAEGLLRAASGLRGVNELGFVEAQAVSGGEQAVRFEDAAGRTHRVRIREHVSETLAYVSCVGDKQAPLINYELIQHEIE
ncbi:MAG: hypothetical protein DWG76_01395 [Chloroflexi bacterium]|nr:hypothetical protein [Chloroflexota bacterium]